MSSEFKASLGYTIPCPWKGEKGDRSRLPSKSQLISASMDPVTMSLEGETDTL